MTSTAPEVLTLPEPGKPAVRAQRGGGLGRYILVRFLLIIPTVFILVTLVFLLMRTIGDPITASVGGRLSPQALEARIHAAGYDRPPFVQYIEYLGQIFTGNFGRTLSDHRPIS
ncbi:MAG: peptide/nickel transport system permease protein, partial [Microbacteriaceae bacterium]|nr:peptide/nickel transport system permease protein [Microbacteriaceae bacterium]